MNEMLVSEDRDGVSIAPSVEEGYSEFTFWLRKVSHTSLYP